MPPPNRTDVITPAIDEGCDQFERPIRSGDRPTIEQYLVVTDEPSRTILLRELIKVECELRRDIGETPDVSDYLPVSRSASENSSCANWWHMTRRNLRRGGSATTN